MLFSTARVYQLSTDLAMLCNNHKTSMTSNNKHLFSLTSLQVSRVLLLL